MSYMEKEFVFEKADFEIPPPPIPAKDIKETVTTDVVVLGAGVAGLTAALSAAEAGAKVIELEKAPGINYRGGWNAALSSKLQKEAGIEVDKQRIIKTIMELGDYRSDQRVVKLWADHCSEVMDWLIDMAEVEKAKGVNIEVILDPCDLERQKAGWYFPSYPIVHHFTTGIKGDTTLQKPLVEMLERNGRALGVDYRFETPAVRLLREGKGRVTGVIAQNKKGDYIQFNATKAVVLCTGDYGNDHEMVKKYCNWRAQALAPYSDRYATATTIATGLADGRVNTGDGHKMGMWIGAAIDDPPHCPMFFDRTSVDFPMEILRSGAAVLAVSFLGLARQPWLCVNKNGERFMDEDIPWAYESNQYMTQPGCFGWKIWDAKCEQEWPKMKEQACKNIGPPRYSHRPEAFHKAIEKGSVLAAETIAELAQKIQVPVETLEATVARYNELARNGEDLDFGKHPDRLTTVEIPPFYANKVGSHYLVILGGLKINTKLQVLDTERNPIPGLYAAGNVSGSFWGDEYPLTTPGASHSRAWTFGRLAGLAAAAEKV